MNRSKITEIEKTGKLTPISDLNKKDKRNRFIWLFRCDCGKEIELAISDVKIGRKIDCGCGKEERKLKRLKNLALTNTLPNNNGPLNKLFGAYKRAAERRGYSFKLTKEEFRKLIKGKCFYCNEYPKSTFTTSNTKNPTSILVYNGIDRKDNHKDYTIDNCLTACGVCNRMKMDLSFEEFMLKISQIYKNQGEYQL